MRRLRRCESGVSAVEFGFVGPIFIMLLMAVFDTGFSIYTRAVLQGAVEEGARTASLENTQWEVIKQRVNNQVRAVIPAANPETDISFEIDPFYYQNYADVVIPEDFTDLNANGRWDPNECFVDRNGNRSYDEDVGIQGRGGAQDVVAIRAQLEFRRAMPLWNMLGQPQTMTLVASTYLRNQPFSGQASRVGVRICP
ncbi:TadE/TadG family type IV pilus assembly protein [Qipengyuania thermophila]|uniref:TadE/TadG family type IV pilus assembly protein n=1 Tax=Qipengyuania thermophila TaxID=2509361 RepID=UPI0013ED7186|nr:TadE/TadG family type IV pilus assembly protein [Qipengyuania thermophila]